MGLSHYEGRNYVGLMRHMILCQLILLFLAEQTGRINAQLLPPAIEPAKTPQGGKITPTCLDHTPSRDTWRPTTDHHSGSAARHDGADRSQRELAVCPMA